MSDYTCPGCGAAEFQEVSSTVTLVSCTLETTEGKVEFGDYGRSISEGGEKTAGCRVECRRCLLTVLYLSEPTNEDLLEALRRLCLETGTDPGSIPELQFHGVAERPMRTLTARAA
jgi:hypothetical protein